MEKIDDKKFREICLLEGSNKGRQEKFGEKSAKMRELNIGEGLLFLPEEIGNKKLETFQSNIYSTARFIGIKIITRKLVNGGMIIKRTA